MKNIAVKTVRIKGRKIQISYEGILKASRQDYSTYKGTDYFAKVEGKEVPAKRLIEQVLKEKGTGLTLQDITTKYAVDILRKLDIPVYRKSEHLHSSRMERLKKLAGSISIGGNAVEEEKKLYSD